VAGRAQCVGVIRLTLLMCLVLAVAAPAAGANTFVQFNPAGASGVEIDGDTGADDLTITQTAADFVIRCRAARGSRCRSRTGGASAASCATAWAPPGCPASSSCAARRTRPQGRASTLAFRRWEP
jgi:hypothetical protein